MEEFLKAEGGGERRKDDDELEGSMDKDEDKKTRKGGSCEKESDNKKSVDGGVSYGSPHTFVCSADPRPTSVKRRLALAKESAWETGLNLPPIAQPYTATATNL